MTLFKKDDTFLEIRQDCDPENPLDMYGTEVAKIATWHSRYTLGTEQPNVPPNQFVKDLPIGTEVLPVYLLDHSGLRVSTKPFQDRWDSGQIGYVYSTPEMFKDFDPDGVGVKAFLTRMVQVYSYYLEGEVFEFIKYREKTCGECGATHREVIDSCGGFYGTDFEGNGLYDSADVEDINDWILVD